MIIKFPLELNKSLPKKLTIAFRILFFLFFLITISSCSTRITKNKGNVEDIPFPKNKNDLTILQVSGSIELNSTEGNNNANFNLILVGNDSLNAEIYGPMGMLLGKLFISTDTLIFYDVFNNQAYVGKASKENFEKTFGLLLDFKDFSKLIRNEAFLEVGRFTKVKDDRFLLYKNISSKDFVDFAVISSDTTIVQYQRKSRDDRIVLNVFYDDFKYYSEYKLPTKIKVEFPLLKTIITFKISNYETNAGIKKSLSFPLPKSITPIELN